MIFTNTITLVLALAPATLFAAPTRTLPSITDIYKRHLSANVVKALNDGVCDLDAATMPTAPTPLPAPAAGLHLSHVAVGRGTQNYTCKSDSPSETPTAVGAVAQLFNATCQAVRAPAVLADVTVTALNHPVPANEIAGQLLSGHHEFTSEGVPLFVLNTDVHKFGEVQAKKNASSPAPEGASAGPNGQGSVAWLKLNAVSGDFMEVYRLNTAGGSPPKTCEGIEGHFTVEYAAEYWFWK
ncbi:hypothetical protein K469DRAFT_546603 [Zopfia rhizophila CBS 207.26]|uniref:Malate dehydrogenase n=1 Tax=Zopfia rhizophila CBS 207.26 TaxID=1314779 RepID=A0A6A6EWE8_9PEZI|nr:hypothetical protein K469DRAFT_546603 [Zopfia rhizophila CBS 207.26]